MEKKNSIEVADNFSEEVVNLLYTIEEANRTLSKTFQNAILRHEQQFIKAYRTKMTQLTKLYQHLKYVLQDKFINNALMNRLQIVMKERDYFKYQCLKLNTQYQNALQDHKNLTMQIRNITEQSSIYKHLLQSQKLRSKEIQKVNSQLKANINEMAKRSSSELVKHIIDQDQNDDNLIELNTYQNRQDKDIVLREQIKKFNSIKKQLLQYKKINKEQDEKIRILKLKVQGLQNVVNDNCIRMINKKQLQDVFRCCVENWKRQLNQKHKKMTMAKTCSSLRKTNNSLKQNNFLQLTPTSTFTQTLFGNATISSSHQSLTSASKKQLLRKFFTCPQFLQFIEDILFNDEIQIQIIKVQREENTKYMERNRRKLLQYFRNRKLVSQKDDTRCRF